MIMRTEHPKPQFMRGTWENLNGPWQFQIDHGCSGEAQGWAAPDKAFDMKINVPFCPESRLSGIAYTDFMNSVFVTRQRPTWTAIVQIGLKRQDNGTNQYSVATFRKIADLTQEQLEQIAWKTAARFLNL